MESGTQLVEQNQLQTRHSPGQIGFDVQQHCSRLPCGGRRDALSRWFGTGKLELTDLLQEDLGSCCGRSLKNDQHQAKKVGGSQATGRIICLGAVMLVNAIEMALNLFDSN